MAESTRRALIKVLREALVVAQIYAVEARLEEDWAAGPVWRDMVRKLKRAIGFVNKGF